MKKRFISAVSVLLTLCMILTLFPTIAYAYDCPMARMEGEAEVMGAATTYTVGEAFREDVGLGYHRKGLHYITEKKYFWANGVPIKAGDVFKEVGQYVMTIKGGEWVAEYKLQVIPALKKDLAFLKKCTIRKKPTKKTYRQGVEAFDPKDIVVRCNFSGGVTQDLGYQDLEFYVGERDMPNYKYGKVIKPGYRFMDAGEKDVIIRVASKEMRIPITVTPSSEKEIIQASSIAPSNGWYKLRIMANYVNINATGAAELRYKNENQAYYVEKKENNQITLKMADGKYLGINESIKDGVQLKAVDSPYLWNSYNENTTGIFSLRSSTDVNMIVNASGEKKDDGTSIILWTNKNFDAPGNAEFQFVPTNDPEKSSIANGWYKLRIMDNYVNINTAGDAELQYKTYLLDANKKLYKDENQAYYVETVGSNQMTLKMSNGKYIGISGTTKDGVRLTAVDSPYLWNNYPENDKDIFSLRPSTNIKLVVNASGNKNKNGTAIILWTHENTDAPNNAEILFIPSKEAENSAVEAKKLMLEVEKPAVNMETSQDFGKVPDSLANTTREEWDVLRLTNIERAREGLPLLVTFDLMQTMAGVRSDELVGNFSHTRPNGTNPNSVCKENKFSYTAFAENIARGQNTAEVAVNDWMNSEGHKKNILTESLRYMGTGYTYNNEGKKWHWVQLFATGGGSECVSITLNEQYGYFTLELKNGITAYAPYDPASSQTVNNKIMFNYPSAE